MTEDDDLRDAHLLAALRHAPDHDVAPPHMLSQAILAQARQAVPATGTGWRAWWKALNQWVSQPALAGAVASVALATVIGVMWRSGAPGVPEPEPPVAIAQAPAQAPALPEPAPVREVAAPPAAAGPPPDSPHAAKAARRGPALAAAPRAPHATTAPATAAAPAAAQVAQAPPADVSLSDAAALRQVLAPDPLADVAVALREQPEAVRVLSHSPARPESFAAAADPARQRSATALRSDTMTTGAQWLARVTQATQGRWQPQAAPPAEADGESRSVLLHGALVGRLQFSGAALWWLPAAPAGQAWRADLDAALLQELLANAPHR